LTNGSHHCRLHYRAFHDCPPHRCVIAVVR
jgi:hypothetical protein